MPNVVTTICTIRNLLNSVSKSILCRCGNHHITGYLMEGNLTGCGIVCGRGNVYATHGNCNTHSIFESKRFLKLCALINSLPVTQRCSYIGEIVRQSVNSMFTGSHFHLCQKGLQNCIGNAVKTCGIGMEVVRQMFCSNLDTTIHKIYIYNAIMLANLFDLSIHCRCIGHIRQHCNDLSIRIVVLHTHDHCNVRIHKGCPLVRYQIDFNRCIFRIKATDCGTTVIRATKHQNDIRCAVRTKVLNTSNGCHSRIRSNVATVRILCVIHSRASPAVVNTKFCIQFGKNLHPPRLVDIHRQIALRISVSVSKVETISHRSISSKCGDTVTHNGDDLVLIIRNFRLVIYLFRQIQIVNVAFIGYCPHGNTYCNRICRCCQVTILTIFRIRHIRSHRLYSSICKEPRYTNTVSAVRCAERICINAITRTNRNSD